MPDGKNHIFILFHLSFHVFIFVGIYFMKDCIIKIHEYMKKIMIVSVCCLMLIKVPAVAQNEKSSYISANVSAGLTSLNFSVREYDGSKSNSSNKIGVGLNAKYNYYFNKHWGIGSGLGFSIYKSRSFFNGSLSEVYDLGAFVDDDASGSPRNFNLRARIENIEEKQNVFFLEIPLTALYQTRFTYGKWGAFGSLGVKILMPVSRNFEVVKDARSKLNVSGFYTDNTQNFDMGAPGTPPVVQHGYGTIDNPGALLKLNNSTGLKTGFAVTFDVGALHRLTAESDLFFGPYIEYFLNDIKNKDILLLSGPAGSYHPDANNNIGKGLNYNGLLNSIHTDKVMPFSFGIKIGVRFKL